MNISENFSFGNNMVMCGYIYVAWTCMYALLLPVFLFILFVGFQECMRPSSGSSTTTHSDVFTFNMAALEVMAVLGSCFFASYFYNCNSDLSNVGKSLLYMVGISQSLLHNLVCLERYLAVVHPITYLHLKKNGAVIRNVSITVVWLLSFGVAYLYHFKNQAFSYFLLFTGMASLVLITFFCVSVLYILIRPGPGEKGGDRNHIDQLKRRAFHTVAAITVTLMLKYVPLCVVYAVYWSETLSDSGECLMAVFSQWLYIPTSLVLPLLFLYRRVKQSKRSK